MWVSLRVATRARVRARLGERRGLVVVSQHFITDLARGTRNNAQIVLRSVLRFAKERGYLNAIPSSLPRLMQPEPSILEIPSNDQAEEILGLACPTQQLAFALRARIDDSRAGDSSPGGAAALVKPHRALVVDAVVLCR